MIDEKDLNTRPPREESQNDLILTDVSCPACGKTFTVKTSNFCPHCFVTVFERDENGKTRLISPTEEEKTRVYKVKFQNGNEETHRAGEVVHIEKPSMTDLSITYFMNGEELTELCFLMPPHDVEITAKTRGASYRANFPSDFGMGMGMNMGKNL